MITFTQKGEVLECDSRTLGNAYSDIVVAVNRTDTMFDGFTFLDLLLVDPISRKTYRTSVLNKQAIIDHSEVKHFGDVYVAMAGYGGSKGQLTTNAVAMNLNRSADPQEAYSAEKDWKRQVNDSLIKAAIETAIAEYLKENELNIPQGGGSGSGDVSLSAVNSVLSTGANFARVGNMGICMGTFTLPAFKIDTAVGNMYYADALIQSNGPLQLEGNFPFAFSQKPTVTVSLSGLTSKMFMGGVRADQAGITRMRLYHPTAKTSTADISCRFIAVGRVDGEHAAAAAVVSEAVKWVNEETYGSYSTLNDYFYDMYEKLIGSTGRNGWCSEFWSVVSYLAGFTDETVCPKGNAAYVIAGKVSDMGNFYIRQGSGTNSKFVPATMTAGKTYDDKTNFAYRVNGTKEYIPQIGDVLFCQGIKSGYYYPHHTAIVVSVDINDEGYFINTVEGNLSNNDEDYEGTSVRRRARNMYTTTQNTGLNVLAVGHIDYPATWNYADKSATGSGGGLATGVASIPEARAFLGLG